MWPLLIKAIPWITTALSGPLADLAITKVSEKLGVPAKTVDEVKQILQGLPPEKVVELKQVDADLQVKLAELGYKSLSDLELLNVRAAENVNVTMQAETKSERWPQYSWRPAIGFSVAYAIFMSVNIVFAAYGMAVFAEKSDLLKELPGILAAIMGLIGVASPILGIASYFRGKQKVAETGEK